MIKELKQKALGKALLLAACLAAVAVALLWGTGFGVLRYLGGAKQFETLPLEEWEGAYVEVDITHLLDYYAYTERFKDNVSQGITEKEYIFPAAPYTFMGVAMSKNRIDEAEDLMERSAAAAAQGGGEEALGAPMHVKGYIMAMDAQTRDFFHETVGADGTNPEYDEMFIPLVLRDGYVSADATVSAMWVYTALALLALGIGVFMVVKAATGGYQKSIRKLCAASPDPDGTLAELERFYEETPPVAGFRTDGTWLMLKHGSHTEILPAQEVAWVHKSTTQHRVYFIPVNKSRALAVYTRGGAQFEVAVSGEAQQDEAQKYLFEHLPGAAFGYSDELAKLFRSDRAAFADIARQQHESAAQQNVTAQQ